MWESTYEVAMIMDTDVNLIPSGNLTRIMELSKQQLNEGARAGYVFVSFVEGILIMKCLVCHNVDEGRTTQCTPHEHGRR